jgi:hypothetical protein
MAVVALIVSILALGVSGGGQWWAVRQLRASGPIVVVTASHFRESKTLSSGTTSRAAQGADRTRSRINASASPSGIAASISARRS